MKVRARTRTIGDDEACFIAAEIGINHNGNMELARRMPDSIVFRRPGTGLPPKALEWIVDRAVTRTIRSGAVLESKDFV